MVKTLPNPVSMTLQNFSLYENQSKIDVQFSPGVFCLAGANGLGKSTFLNALNFAVTGVVAEPERKFDSLSEYYRFTSPYARSYFDGRISREHRELATVRITLQVGHKLYTLERAFFDVESLTFFEIEGAAGKLRDDAEFSSNAERNTAYKDSIVDDCGLAQFEQLVFLQHFLLTFDEQHRLLLWDERTIDQALLLAFGVDAAVAARADEHRRQAERLDSQARNLQYQATTAEGRIADLRQRLTADETEAQPPDASFEQLEAEWEATADRVKRLTGELTAAQTAEADSHARLAALEQEYENAFKSLLGSHPEAHPNVINTLQSDRCDFCGSHGAASRLAAKLQRHVCPLCDAETLADASSVAVEDLVADLKVARTAARLASERVSEVVALRQASLSEMSARQAQRDDALEGANDAVVLSSATVGRLVAQYELEADDARRRRDEFRARRDAHRDALKPIARDLARKYAAAEERFVPRFTALAHRFLGLDVDVHLQQKGARTSMVVSVEGTERRTFDQLSESQRYFLDIALRMALVDYIAGVDGGCLYIDTPEGSLDISYEARAGEMFADFASSSNRLVMTANINTSQLLLSLARRSHPGTMQIVRMMEWTSLSDVQAAGEDLFTKAFRELRDALLEGSQGA